MKKRAEREVQTLHTTDQSGPEALITTTSQPDVKIQKDFNTVNQLFYTFN